MIRLNLDLSKLDFAALLGLEALSGHVQAGLNQANGT
jgi:hypothetical protein